LIEEEVVEELRAQASTMSEGELKRKINDMRNIIASKEKQLRGYFDEMKIHRRTINELRNKRDELNSKAAELFGKGNELKEKRNEINSRISSLKEEKNKIREKVKSISDKISTLRNIREKYNNISKGKLGTLSQEYLRELDVFLNADIPLEHEMNIYQKLLSLSERIESAKKAEGAHA